MPKEPIEWVVWVIFVLFCLFALVQLWFYLYHFSGIAFFNKKEKPSSFPPLSVLICAKNEAENLQKNIPFILGQDYPDFEVVVINDGSWDESEHVLKKMAEENKLLRVITIKEDENYAHGKKLAVTVGIKGAKSEYLVFTDADCRPATKQWLKTIGKNFDQDHDVILGYGAYEKKPGFLNKMIRFDTFTIALMYLSFATRKRPYMGVGRNLAYKRSLFFKNKGFATHYFIDSGDDDLFVNEAATGRNTFVEINADSLTVSEPELTFRNWLRQKRRHASTFKYYKFSTRWMLTWFGLSQYLFYILFLPLIILWYQPFIIIPIFAFRMLVQIVIFRKSMTRLGEKDLFALSPLLEATLMFVYPMLSFSNRFSKKHKWKG